MSEDGSCIIEAGGVGYDVSIPLGMLGRVKNIDLAALASENASDATSQEIILFIHTHVREDSLSLFGFPTKEDRQAFRHLLSVSSVGPKVALSIMGVLNAEQLAAAISSGDKAAFKGITGVGKKTVERLLLDLKDKIKPIQKQRSSGLSVTKQEAGASGPFEQVVQALVNMGYKPVEAYKAVEKLDPAQKEEPLPLLLRKALAAMS